jgi:formate hydrogenlyase subunit 3/multisubunit Na+/H+ antiporter MnhD subunit
MPVAFQLDGAWWAALATLAWSLPALMAVLLGWSRARGAVVRAAPVAALPALVLALAGPAHFTWDWFVLGSTFRLHPATSIWLFFTAALWCCAGWFGVYYLADDARRARYTFYFLGAMTGNIGLVLAGDPITFFTFFAMMSFLSYGLIIHDGREESRRAGRVYLGMAILGEVLQFAALSLLVFPIIGTGEAVTFQSLEKSGNGLIVALILGGYGIKAGLLGLHMWLPMAHPVAPTPASAVLSGSMIKAGLLGWITLLPLGHIDADMATAGHVVIAMGLAGAVLAAGAGAVQVHPKAVLAYSSVSQMGLMISAVGVAMAAPRIAYVLQWIIVLYVVHHGVAKCLLFLSVGLKPAVAGCGSRWNALFWGGTIVAALALVGAPFTSGMVAKSAMKDAMANSWMDGAELVVAVFSWAAVGTALLMVRFVMRLRAMPVDAHHAPAGGLWAPWVALLVLTITLTPYLYVELLTKLVIPLAALGPSWKQVWPLVVGVGIYAAVTWSWRRMGWPAWTLPPGDVWHVLARAFSRTKDYAGERPVVEVAVAHRASRFDGLMAELGRWEENVRLWRFGAVAFAVMAGLLILAALY